MKECNCLRSPKIEFRNQKKHPLAETHGSVASDDFKALFHPGVSGSDGDKSFINNPITYI
jgi:hypothetical protein